MEIKERRGTDYNVERLANKGKRGKTEIIWKSKPTENKESTPANANGKANKSGSLEHAFGSGRVIVWCLPKKNDESGSC